MRYLGIFAFLCLGVAAFLWAVTGAQPEHVTPPAERAVDRAQPKKARRLPGGQQMAAADKATPRLLGEQQVMVDKGPRRPQEPGHTYSLRMRFVDQWEECRQAIGIDDEQAQVILLAFYDYQQQETEIESMRLQRLTLDERMGAVGLAYDELQRKVQKALSSEQRYKWGITPSCTGLSILATDGVLRMPHDKPEDVYRRLSPERIERLLQEND